MQLAGLDRLVAHLVDVAADRQPGRALFHDERADAAVRRRGRRVGLRQQQEHVRPAPVGDPHLRAVDDVRVAVAPRRRRDRLQVGARVRFREADAGARFALREPRQETLLLIRGAVLRQHVAEHEVRAEDAREAHPPARQLLEDDGEGGVVDVAAAVLLGDVEAEQAQRLHRLDERVRVLVAVFHARGNRDHFAIDELADRPRDQLLLLVQLEHGISWKTEVVQAFRPARTADLKVRTTTDNHSCCAIVRIANEFVAAGRNHRDRPRAGRGGAVRHAAAGGPGRAGDQDRAPRRR